MVVIDNFKICLSKWQCLHVGCSVTQFKLREVVFKNLQSSNDSILAFSDMFEISDKYKVKKLYYLFQQQD